MAMKTQGTHLFFVDSVSQTDPEVKRLVCPASIEGLGGARDQIETTCLDDTADKQFIAGLGNPGQVTATVVFDAAEVSHQNFFTLKDSGETLHWMIGMTDGTSEPTLNSDEGLDPVDDRSFIAFDGYVADFNMSWAGNSRVEATLLIQRSGAVTPYWKSVT